MAGGRCPKYIHEIPYSRRLDLCELLDADKGWERLAGEIGYTHDKILILRIAYTRPKGSPTDDLLTEWSHSRPTIERLHTILTKLNRAREVLLLKDLIPKRPQTDGPPDYYNTRDFDELDEDDLPGPPSLQQHTCNSFIESDAHRRAYMKKGASLAKSDLRNFNPPPLPPKSFNKNMGYYSDTSTRRPSEGDDCSAGSLGSWENKYPLSQTLSFKYQEVIDGTDNFNQHNQLGQGAFGSVYKGIIRTTPFAVKRLSCMYNTSKSKDPHGELVAVMQSMILYRHDNIVQLCAYCLDSPAELGPCLIYQYMSNGSLKDRLERKNDTKALTWLQRCNIMMGAAKGIQYLHSSNTQPLIHGDIKSSNILLDKYFEAKITDFGLAQYAVNSEDKGDKGRYTHVTVANQDAAFFNKAGLPPEFFRSQQLSTKTDTYSFGVVILEVCTGLPALNYERKDDLQYLRNLVREYDDHTKVQDKSAGNWPAQVYAQLFDHGLKCTERLKKNRPEMTDVYKKMEQICVSAQRYSRALREMPRRPSSVDDNIMGPSFSPQPHLDSDPFTQSNEQPTTNHDASYENIPEDATAVADWYANELQLNDKGKKVPAPYVNQEVIEEHNRSLADGYASDLKKMEEIERWNGSITGNNEHPSIDIETCEDKNDVNVNAPQEVSAVSQTLRRHADKLNVLSSLTTETPMTPYKLQEHYDAARGPLFDRMNQNKDSSLDNTGTTHAASTSLRPVASARPRKTSSHSSLSPLPAIHAQTSQTDKIGEMPKLSSGSDANMHEDLRPPSYSSVAAGDFSTEQYKHAEAFLKHHIACPVHDGTGMALSTSCQLNGANLTDDQVGAGQAYDNTVYLEYRDHRVENDEDSFDAYAPNGMDTNSDITAVESPIYENFDAGISNILKKKKLLPPSMQDYYGLVQKDGTDQDCQSQQQHCNQDAGAMVQYNVQQGAKEPSEGIDDSNEYYNDISSLTIRDIK